jgi:phage tail-like protein
MPVKVEGPALDATSNEVAIESLELTHEGISRA